MDIEGDSSSVDIPILGEGERERERERGEGEKGKGDKEKKEKRRQKRKGEKGEESQKTNFPSFWLVTFHPIKLFFKSIPKMSNCLFSLSFIGHFFDDDITVFVEVFTPGLFVFQVKSIVLDCCVCHVFFFKFFCFVFFLF